FDLGSATARSALPLDTVALAEALEAEGAASTHGGPWVATNMVATLDGAAMLAGRSGQIGGPGDRVLFAAIRALADVIVAGAATVRTERYRPAVPPPEVQAWRVTNGRAPMPTPAVVTASGRLGDVPLPAPRAEGEDLPRPIVYGGPATPEAAITELGAVPEVVQGTSPMVLPTVLVDDLARRGHRRILCEGGPDLLAQFHEHDLVDDWFVTIGPIVSGGPA